MTDFLFARPSILEGIGRNMDFFDSLNAYNYSNEGEEADIIGLNSDLLAIYKDFHKAYGDTLCQLETKNPVV
jgi:hypothetical protein